MTRTFKGGARFGHANATWPLATLTVDEEAVVIEASVVGSQRFRPEEVVEVKVVRWLPLIAQGVQVIHTRDDAPERIIFWTLRSPAKVLEGIRSTGFEGTASAADLPPPIGFPFRWPFAIGFVLVWNALFLFDRPWEPERIGGPGMFVALALLFLLSVGVRFLAPLQRIALSSPRALESIRPLLNITTLVSLVLLIALLVTRLL